MTKIPLFLQAYPRKREGPFVIKLLAI